MQRRKERKVTEYRSSTGRSELMNVGGDGMKRIDSKTERRR